MSDGQVTNNPSESRYELTIQGNVAVAAYRQQENVITFTHTAVPKALENQGIASRLIKAALDDVRRRNLKIVPECSFVSSYVQRHPEAQDLLAK